MPPFIYLPGLLVSALQSRKVGSGIVLGQKNIIYSSEK
jgi:hypothetical protein